MSSMILLHDGSDSGGGLALKVESLSIALSKTPIQIPLPGESPQLLDLNMIRPNITIGGTVENTVATGDNYTLATSATTDGGLDGDPASTDVAANNVLLKFDGTYTYPDKATLEYFFTSEAYIPGNELALIILDPSGTSFSFYNVSGQAATFILAPGTEDRYSYNLVFAAGLRNQVSGT
jgi:hypothetical protein